MPTMTQPFREAPTSYESEGAHVSAIVYEPTELTSPAPAVLYCPGAAEEIPTMDFLPKACARHGYIVLTTAYRGKNWDTDDADAMAALAWLQAMPLVDGERMAVIGHFRGGLAALRTAAKDKRVKSVVALSAPYFLAQWVNGSRALSEVIYQDMVRVVGGTPEDQPERYRDLSPLFMARSITAPVLLIHGTAGLYVPMEHALWMYTALGHSGNTNVDLKLPIWAGHYFDHALTGSFHEYVAELSVGWLNDTLGLRA